MGLDKHESFPCSEYPREACLSIGGTEGASELGSPSRTLRPRGSSTPSSAAARTPATGDRGHLHIDSPHHICMGIQAPVSEGVMTLH